ncbi:hypothetical protein G9A89_014947 [Geosiphon pyriformis]|nr:hypothetical protein G9A89_014947 [Geosiphon pyriformis]
MFENNEAKLHSFTHFSSMENLNYAETTHFLKRGKQKKRKRNIGLKLKEETVEDLITGIEEKKNLLESSQFYKEIKESIQGTLLNPVCSSLVDIVSYGIGSIQDSRMSQYQFAFLLLLWNLFQIPGAVYAYDPIFTTIDVQILLHYGIKLIDKNEEIGSITIFICIQRRNLKQKRLIYLQYPFNSEIVLWLFISSFYLFNFNRLPITHWQLCNPFHFLYSMRLTIHFASKFVKGRSAFRMGF